MKDSTEKEIQEIVLNEKRQKLTWKDVVRNALSELGGQGHPKT